MNVNFEMVIRGGTVVTEGGRGEADIGIANGRIVAIGVGLPRGGREIDAHNRLVLPGGIDSHVHVDQISSAGVRTADDFASATVTAAHGGITTIIPFAAQRRGDSLRETVAAYHARAEGRAVVDYAFHVIVSDATETVIRDEIPALVAGGITSFKVYMTYDAVRLPDRQILDVMDAARRQGATVMVHAESHDLLGWLTDRLIAEGCTAPRYHADARPSAIEREAVHRAITMTEIAGGRVLLVHVSGKESVEQLRWARGFGIPIHAETCPQYLVLTRDCLDLPGFEGAKFCCSPPPRDAESQEALWRGLKDGVLQVFSSDHSVYRFDDPEGKKVHGTDAPFNRIPMGMPGLETSLPILFSRGVAEGRLSLERFVALTATNAARLYGLYPRKGTISVGSDADLAVWDPAHRWTLHHRDLHGVADYSPYEGMEMQGGLDVVLCRGTIVCRSGDMLAPPGHGRFLPCAVGSDL